LDFPLLADENINHNVIHFLRENGGNVQAVLEEGLVGQSDQAILRWAYQSGRVVLTHDSDFGSLAIAQSQSFIGIIYLRPGHIRGEFTIQTLEFIAKQQLDVRPPFIVVAARTGQTVRLRVRQL
jgi:predicted nuclease of predicted toxin-antitoxin system